MTQDMHALAVRSVEQNLSPKQLIGLYRKAGFLKNARGKAWTVGAVYQHQVRVRKAMPKATGAVVTHKELEKSKRNLIAKVLESDQRPEAMLKMIEQIYSGERTSFAEVRCEVKQDLITLSIDSYDETETEHVTLTRDEAKALLAVFEQIESFANEVN